MSLPDDGAAGPAAAPGARHPSVVLLGGASGSGKSYLADRFGRPHLDLDSFYREIAEDTPATPLPRTPYGEIDWDHPGTWNLDSAVDALVELIETGRTRIPDYLITTSSVVGHQGLELGEDAGPVVAEGVFAHVAAGPLRAACAELGVDLQAFYIDQPRFTTAARRFARDVAERRKPVPFLIQRGWALARSEHRTRALHLEAGFEPVHKPELKRRLASLAP